MDCLLYIDRQLMNLPDWLYYVAEKKIQGYSYYNFENWLEIYGRQLGKSTKMLKESILKLYETDISPYIIVNDGNQFGYMLNLIYQIIEVTKVRGFDVYVAGSTKPIKFKTVGSFKDNLVLNGLRISEIYVDHFVWHNDNWKKLEQINAWKQYNERN